MREEVVVVYTLEGCIRGLRSSVLTRVKRKPETVRTLYVGTVLVF